MTDYTLIDHLPLSAAMAEGDSVFGPSEAAWIEDTYLSMFGRRVRKCNCRSRLTDAAFEIRQKLKEMNSKYNMKAGMLLWIGNDAYSRRTVTDAIAEQWFESLPDGCDRVKVWQHYFGESPMPSAAVEDRQEVEASTDSKPKPRKTTKKSK